MKTVIIKEIRLLNFKGLRDLTVEFDPALTEIYGRNGIGKTSIFDGFTWLLFGKNSEDRNSSASRPTTRPETSSRNSRTRYRPSCWSMARS